MLLCRTLIQPPSSLRQIPCGDTHKDGHFSKSPSRRVVERNHIFSPQCLSLIFLRSTETLT
jgi:hypothetical protein